MENSPKAVEQASPCGEEEQISRIQKHGCKTEMIFGATIYGCSNFGLYFNSASRANIFFNRCPHPFLTVATRVLYRTVETSNWSGDIQISSEVVGCCLGMCIDKNSRPPFKDANGPKRKGSSRLDEGQFFE